jgi:hypothetical protein
MLGMGMVLVCSLLPLVFVSWNPEEGKQREFFIRAQQYAYNPPRIVVDQGDQVHIHLASLDVVHGFFLEGYDIEANIYPGVLPFYLRYPSASTEYTPVKKLVFTADRPGKFRYRCSVTCGTLHPFMLGEMIVRPNYPYMVGMGGVVGVFLASFVIMYIAARRHSCEGLTTQRPWRFDLLEGVPGLKWLVRRRWLQYALVLPMLALFLVFLVAGFFGSPIGNRNIIITFVWILWWFLLISLMLPLGSRIWCLICPFPFIGEWFQRRRLLGPGPCDPKADADRMKGLNKKWPAALSNIWLQNIFFLVLCTFSAILVTRPVVTAFALAGIAITATVMHLIYRRRSFCIYVCPVSGFLGLYSMTSLIEVRAKDPEICAKCTVKAGLVGNEQGWACPWFQNPSKMTRNNYCGLCMECIRACPNECMTLQARPFCSDVKIKGYDEAWKAFIMISIALVYTATLLGPWGTLKAWANISEAGNWKGFSAYAGAIWFTALAGMPALWAIAARLGRRLSGNISVSAKDIFVQYTYLLVPLGLMAWIAFSLPLILVNTTCVLNTISDPIGWGWDLCGTAMLPWKPYFPEYVVYVQIPLLLAGLGFSLKRGYELAGTMYHDAMQGMRSLIPMGILCTVLTMVFLRLFAG